MPKVKLYSVDEAERTLPYVRRILKDISSTFERYEELRARREALAPRPTPGSREEDTAFRLEGALHDTEQALLRYQKELADMGVELKDFRSGLIDFYSRYQDRLVYLCWKMDEPDRLEWWHQIEAGFRGRQAITGENRHAFKGDGEAPQVGPSRPHRDGAGRT